jgi:hypothetical protein
VITKEIPVAVVAGSTHLTTAEYCPALAVTLVGAGTDPGVTVFEVPAGPLPHAFVANTWKV